MIIGLLLLVISTLGAYGQTQTMEYRLHEPTNRNPIYKETLKSFLYSHKIDKIGLSLQLKLIPQKNGFFKVAGSPVFKTIFGSRVIRIDSQEVRYKLSDTASQSFTFVNGKEAYQRRRKAEARLKNPKVLSRKEWEYLVMKEYDYNDLAKNHPEALSQNYYRDCVREAEFVGKQKINKCGRIADVYVFNLRLDTHHEFFYSIGFIPNIGIVWIGGGIYYGTTVFFELRCPKEKQKIKKD